MRSTTNSSVAWRPYPRNVRTVIDGIDWWSAPADHGLPHNAYVVSGSFVVNPFPSEPLLAACRAAGVHAAVCTDGAHEAATSAFAALLDVPLSGEPHDEKWIVVPIAANERAFVSASYRCIISGVSIDGSPAGALTLSGAARADRLRDLAAVVPQHLLVARGTPIFGHAREQLHAMLDAICAPRVVNLDALRFEREDDPAPFTAAWAEIGERIGSRKLGIAAITLAPGEAMCPYHWHTTEEEFMIVWRGEPTLRTPQGTQSLRPGDCVAFPTGATGAHRLDNHRGNTPAVVLMLASNDEEGDSCFYPDSSKHVVAGNGVRVRSFPQLEYFDGET